MKRLCVAPIIEGHGEYRAIGILLRRIWTELLGGEYVQVMRPIRCPRSKLALKEELGRRITLAASKLQELCSHGDPHLILVLFDADDDKPCVLAPKVLAFAQESRPDVDVVCVLANLEYETWFVAAAESLREFLDFSSDAKALQDPEGRRSGKGWIKKHFKRPRYSETLDQPGMTAKMDLELCRKKSPSFDKLCRELENRR